MLTRLAIPRASLLNTARFSPIRKMASKSTAVTVPEGMFEFLVVAPDKPGVREKRMEVRQYVIE